MKQKLSRADVQQLHELAAMKGKGILTSDEFSTLKGALLDGGRPVPSRKPALWLVGAGVFLLIIAAAVDTTSGGSAAHGIGRVVADAQR
jgi:hypothetical protein